MLGEWAEGTEWQEQYLIGQGREKVDIIQSDKKKRELLKHPTKIEEIQEKKIIDRN